MLVKEPSIRMVHAAAESDAFASKNLKHTHSKATCCVEDNNTAFIVCFATSTNSAHHPDAEQEQDDHVDSARFLPRLKLTI